MDPLYIGGVITALGTALLTIAGVWKLLTGPLTRAISSIEEVVTRLEARLSDHERSTEADVKEIWKHLATRKLNE